MFFLPMQGVEGGRGQGSTLMSEIRPGVCSGSKCVMDLKVTCLVELTQPQKPSLGKQHAETVLAGAVVQPLEGESPYLSEVQVHKPLQPAVLLPRIFLVCSIVSNGKKLESTTIIRQRLIKLW